MPKSKRTLIICILAFILLLLLTQFGTGLKQYMNQPRMEEDDGDYSEPVSTLDKEGLSLKIDVSLPQQVFKELMSVSGQFERQYGIVVELRNRPEHELSEGLRQSLALEQSADVIMIRSERVKPMALSGKLLNQDPSVEMWSNTPEWSKELVSWNGYVWGVPFYVDPYVMVWNPALLQAQTGLKKPPITGRDWQAAIRGRQGRLLQMQSSQPESGSLLSDTEQADLDKEMKRQAVMPWFAWEEKDPYALLALMWRLGMIAMPSNHANPDVVTPSATLNMKRNQSSGQLSSYRWQETLLEWEAYRSLFQSASHKEERSIWEKIERGDVRFAIVPYSEAAPRLGERLTVEIPRDVVPPYGTWVKSMSYVVPAHTKMEKEAKSWIQFVTAAEQQKFVLRSSFMLPASRSSQDQTGDLWNRHLPAIYLRADIRLIEAMRHSSALEQWQFDVQAWIKAEQHTETLVKKFQTLWTQ